MTMDGSGALTMTLAQKVATFAPQHAALTRELDELERVAKNDLPNLQNALEYIHTSVTNSELLITQGRAKLRREWKTHVESVADKSEWGNLSLTALRKNKDDTSTKAKLQQEYAAFQDAMARWTAQELELQENKRQEILTMQKLYEARDTASRYTRLSTHLDRMHALVFAGVKIEMPEYEFLEWQVQCANTDGQALQAQLAAEMAAQKLVNASHSTLSQIDKQYTKIEQYSPVLPGWWTRLASATPAELKDEMLASVGGALGLVERLKESMTKTTKALNDHNAAGLGCRVMVPSVQLMLTMPVGSLVLIEGKSVSVSAPRGLIQGSEDEMTEMLSKAINSVRHAVQMLDIERESVQRRIDQLVLDTTQLNDVLQNEHTRRRALRRQLFDQIAQQAGLEVAGTPAATSTVPSTSRPLPPQPNGATTSPLSPVLSPQLPAEVEHPSEHPPAYRS